MLQRVKNIFHLLEAVVAALAFGFPSRNLVIIGVTGTDGKTTTTNLIHHILTAAGYRTGILSTLSGLHTTTPGRWKVQKFLATAKNGGCTHIVLEVSSHAIDQYRVWGINFQVGVLTNIADHEHLDYHGTFERYRNTKIKFLKSCRKIIVNADDLSSARLLAGLRRDRYLTYGIYQPADINSQNFPCRSKLIGEFNEYNLLAAIAAAKILGIEAEVISKAVGTFEPLSGRMEIVNRRPFTVIVDFAHTPQAFGKVLPEARNLLGKNGRLIHVFGATGDRDKSKRPLMGQIASQYDDVIMLTHEDTYAEDPSVIISQIEKGINGKVFNFGGSFPDEKRKYYLRFAQRKEAIKQAIELAKPGDVVLLTGVGHQRSMNIGGKEIPWSEQKIAKDLLGHADHR